ncbi:hypothetical protein M2651_07605 [Clostridium sp. SYSU_GA19001]|nr:hypothetical protein [Clostridium caldaquaticum]MCM8710889.1 hypothetical protein [Clostridium caldaquaticum]
MLKGIAMNTKELKELVIFLKEQGISPTVKELCTKNIYLSQYKNKRVS